MTDMGRELHIYHSFFYLLGDAFYMLHCYSLNGYHICMDVESGAIHVLEKLPFEMLQFLQEDQMTAECPAEVIAAMSDRYAEAEIRQAYDELYGLYREGMLFSKRDYEIRLEPTYPIKALCLHISHDCNLRCKYCFAEGGDFAQGRKVMPFEVAKKAIDFVIERSEKRRNIEVDFFGGEPLMNFEVVKQTVSYARSLEESTGKRFRFTLTTNGMLLTDEVMDYLNQEMSNVVLSLDGRKCVNDAVRVRVDGTGSYDKIVPKFQKFVRQRKGKDYYVRGTFTAQNLDFGKDVVHLKELGFEQVSVEPVVLDSNHPMALKESMLEQIYAEYESLAKKMIEYKRNGDFFNFFHFMIDLQQGPCVIKRVKGCGSGSEYLAVTPDGDIYPCHRFAGMPEFRMGNVLDGTQLNETIRRQFTAATVLAKPECENCFAKYYCSGGCAANNFNENGDILKPHKMSCELERKRIECAIMIKAAEAEMAEKDV